ncbi:MAG TPA: TolC family protein [Polyangiaceae bacterium]|nr:TolC family protein [Polyangiaceae bacterium]
MSRRGTWWWAAAATGVTWAGLVSAQTAPPAVTNKPVAPGAAEAPPGAAASVLATEPELPNISDPMLETPAAPRRVLATWQQAIALVRSNSTTLRSTQARVRQAEAASRQALSAALPSFTGDAALTHNLLRGERVGANGAPTAIPDPRTYWNAGLNLRVPVLAPFAWAEHGASRLAVTSAKLDGQELERQEIALVASTIVSVVTAERLAEVSRVSLRSVLSTLDLNKRRAALGAASAVDVLRVEQEVSDTRAQIVASHESLLRAREALGAALGFSEPWGVTPDIRLDALAQDTRTSCRPEKDVESRPDVRAARAGVEAAERSAGAVSYDFWPTIDAVSNLTYWSEPTAINNEHVTWTIGGVLTWRFYDGGSRYALRASREANVSLEQARLLDARRRATVEVTQALRGVHVAEANLAVSARSREIARETSRLTRVAYLNGSGTSFDLVDAARRLRAAELDLAIKEFEVLQAKIAALLALATCRV